MLAWSPLYARNGAPAGIPTAPLQHMPTLPSEMMSTEKEDKRLMTAVSRSAASMQMLGVPGQSRCAGGSGAAALRALGHGADSKGNPTLDQASGLISRQLLQLDQLLREERAARQRIELERDELSARVIELNQLSIEHYESARLAAATQSARADCRVAQVEAALSESRREAEQLRAEHATATQHATEAAQAAAAAAALVEKSALDASATLDMLRVELRAAEAEAATARERAQVEIRRTAAAAKIQEKYRGRSRRAKELAADLRNTLPLTSEWSKEFEKLLKGQGVPAEQENLRHLWECQLRCLRSKSHRCRWHPEVLSWCADVWRRDRGAYEQMAFAGMLLLPHPDTVRKYCSSSVAQPGHNCESYEALGVEMKDWTDAEREVVLKFDEINILSGLAWRKVSTRQLPPAPAPAPARVRVSSLIPLSSLVLTGPHTRGVPSLSCYLDLHTRTHPTLPNTHCH